MANKRIEKMIQGLNILIVDDNAYMRRLTRMMLTNLGAKAVLEASDGLAALEAIRNSDPDVMLLAGMPVLNGIEVLRIVRSPGVFPRPDLPVIMLTTRAQRSYVHEALRAGIMSSCSSRHRPRHCATADLHRVQAAADDEARQ
jgi:CheY-like chemotaxis protein